jgi:hypothetical protein
VKAARSSSASSTTSIISDTGQECIVFQLGTLALPSTVAGYSSLPTLCARDCHPRGGCRIEQNSRGWTAIKKNGKRYGASLPELALHLWGGRLNPEWAEWYMGFPLKWTELDASEMPSSRNAHKSSPASSKKNSEVEHD